MLERCFTAIVKDSGNDSSADAKDLVPGDSHDDEHDQVEECELEDDEEAVEDNEQEQCSDCVKHRCLDAGSLLDSRVMTGFERLVELFELAPEIVILDMSFAKFLLVFITHVEFLALAVPNEDFLDTR